VRRGGELDGPQSRLLAGLGATVCRLWREPDEGIWEKRSGRFHHTFSKVMCWVALDRLLRLAEAGKLRARIPTERFQKECAALRQAIETAGWNERLGSYADVLCGDGADASLLLLGVYGYLDPRSPRFQSTFAHLDRELDGAGLFYRYPPGTDGIASGEAAFALCSFWAVEALARMGRTEEAARRFEQILAYRNDVGLYAEEIEPGTGAALGNFPQAFPHVGLINAALLLAEAQGETAPAAAAAGTSGGANRTSGKTGARV